MASCSITEQEVRDLFDEKNPGSEGLPVKRIWGLHRNTGWNFWEILQDCLLLHNKHSNNRFQAEEKPMAKIDEIERDAVKKAAYFENRTEAQELEDHKWAVKNGLSFSGPGALSKAIAASKKRAATKARKSKVGTSFDPGVLEAFKAKAERVGIPYQTLLNSIVKRYTEGKLDIEPA